MEAVRKPKHVQVIIKPGIDEISQVGELDPPEVGCFVEIDIGKICQPPEAGEAKGAPQEESGLAEDHTACKSGGGKGRIAMKLSIQK